MTRIRALRTALLVVGLLALAVTAVPAQAMRLTEPERTESTRSRCLDPDGVHGDGRSASRLRSPDHPEVTAAEKQAINGRTDRILASKAEIADSAAGRGASIPVHVHVMLSKSGEGDVSRLQIDQQIAVLNRQFGGHESSEAANTRFTFTLAGVQRYYNDKWHTDKDSLRYRARTRVGGPETLNIWLVDFSALGIATFPFQYDAQPKTDGIRVHFDSLPGGSLKNYNLGGTATHEIGHWLGLFHTFDGGCSRSNDGVGDTPAQKYPTSGCPDEQDSCTERRGVDPIHNYMDYSFDRCYNQFTPGQSMRMAEMWTAYRA